MPRCCRMRKCPKDFLTGGGGRRSSVGVVSAAGIGLDFFLSGDAVVNAIVLGSLPPPLKLCC